MYCVHECHIMVCGFVSFTVVSRAVSSGSFPLIHLWSLHFTWTPHHPFPSCYWGHPGFTSALSLVLCMTLQLAFSHCHTHIPISPVTDTVSYGLAAHPPFHTAMLASLVVHRHMTYCFLLAQSHSYRHSCSATNLQTPVDWKFQNRFFSPSVSPLPSPKRWIHFHFQKLIFLSFLLVRFPVRNTEEQNQSAIILPLFIKNNLCFLRSPCVLGSELTRCARAHHIL